jgi:hypothetical protein
MVLGVPKKPPIGHAISQFWAGTNLPHFAGCGYKQTCDPGAGRGKSKAYQTGESDEPGSNAAGK